jgi:hypothetical protein
MPFLALNMLVFFGCSLFLPLFQLPSLFTAGGRLSGWIVPLMRRWMEDVCPIFPPNEMRLPWTMNPLMGRGEV